MKEYIVLYNSGSGWDGYSPERKTFSACVEPGEDDGYTGVLGLKTDEDAKWAAFTFIERIKSMYPDLNAYPYKEIRLYVRHVEPWMKYEQT